VQRWLDSAGYAIEAPARLASAATTWLEPVGGPGWAAAGDAAAAFDPLSSHGLATALWSGRHAALAATAELSGDAAPLARYVETLGHAVQGFLRQRRGVYAREQRWREERFWQRRVG
jgi:flavin-dependent dehydrogenase